MRNFLFIFLIILLLFSVGRKLVFIPSFSHSETYAWIEQKKNNIIYKIVE